jgi:hypothetical protein
MNNNQKIEFIKRDVLKGKCIFLSASFPSSQRSPRFFQSSNINEITQAVVCLMHAVLSGCGRIVFGGHPTISPLALMVAQEYLPSSLKDREIFLDEKGSLIKVYQSEDFRQSLPESTKKLFQWGLGEIVWTPSAKNIPSFTAEGTLIHGTVKESLNLMRNQMIKENDPVAAIFIGGMEGIHDEAMLFKKIYSNRPIYPIGAPGGASREIESSIEFSKESLLTLSELKTSCTYPSLMQRIVIDIGSKLNNRQL